MKFDTQADFAAVYRSPLIDPKTRARFYNYRDPALYGNVAITIFLGYHPLTIKPLKEQVAKRLLEKVVITDSDTVAIIGGAFGWLGEYLPGKVYSVDTSEWVHNAKDQSADDELRDAIIAGGLDPDAGIGKQLFDRYSDPSPRAKIPVYRTLAEAPKPSVIITEELWQVLDEKTKDEMREHFSGKKVAHILDGKVM